MSEEWGCEEYDDELAELRGMLGLAADDGEPDEDAA